MLLEALAYATLDGPAYARRMGFATELVGIRARYGRCRRQWRPHLLNSRAAIVEAAEKAPGNRLAVVMGAGWLLDVPVRDLAERFDQVILLDLMRPIATRLSLVRPGLGRVRYLAHDVTGALAGFDRAVEQARHEGRRLDLAPLSTGQPPADAGRAQDADLVISLNLASQLPVVPRHHLERRLPPELRPPEAASEAWLKRLIEGHMAMLRDLPGRAAVICDAKEIVRQPGKPTERYSAVEDVPLPLETKRWRWQVVPEGELPDGVTIENEVVFIDGI